MFSWHQDVNPFNILVKSRGAGSYACNFKLADLGLSHFEKHISFLRDASTQGNFGTSTYGIVVPSHHKNVGSANLGVRRSRSSEIR